MGHPPGWSGFRYLARDDGEVIGTAGFYVDVTITAHQRIGPTGRQDLPPRADGLIFHAGVGEGDEFFTISVWESMQAYDAFAGGFRDTLSEAGFEGGKPVILPVHHVIDHGVPS